MDFKREQLGDVLRELLGKRNLRWVIRGAGIVILQDSKPASQIERFSATDSIPHGGTIKGTVTVEEGYPLPGATVVIKGTKKGTTTNSQGGFILSDVPKMSLVYVSYTGYEPQEFRINGSETLIVKLRRAVGALEEQVVIAYGTVSRRLLTGSIGRVTSKEIETQPISNPLAAIQGRVTGIQIAQTSGLPGSRFNVQIRGRNSIDQGNEPFYIIDGVPYVSNTLVQSGGTIIAGGSPLNYFSPGDIESIEVLRDADALAIYGSRGANGAILITTKKGKNGKTKVDLNLYQGFGQIGRKLNLLNTRQYLDMRYEALYNDGVLLTPGTSGVNDLTKWDTTRYTDWQNELIGGTSRLTNARVSTSGGTTNTQFLFGAGYYRETTVFPGAFSDQKYSLHFSINHKSNNDKFTAAFTGNYVIDNNNLIRADLTNMAISLPPVAPNAYNQDGSLNWQNNTWVNPFSEIKKKYNGSAYNTIFNSTVGYKILPSLTLKSSFGYTRTSLDETNTIPISSLNPFGTIKTGSTDFSNASIRTWIIEPQAEYSVGIGKGKLTALVGSTIQQNVRENTNISATGYTNDSQLKDIKSAQSIFIANSDYSKYRYLAIFGRVNYILNSRYLLNITGRRDGSSRFGPGRQFANFGAVGIGWLFSNEDFVKKNLSVLNFGKLRMSYGTTGNDLISDYGFWDLWISRTRMYLGDKGLYSNRLFNPDYAWEINKKMEAAIELGFFKEHLFFSLNYYRNRSGNQLVNYPLPNITGFNGVTSNLPAVVQNTGVEVEVKSINVANKNFSWKTSLNLTVPRNKLVRFPNFENTSYANQFVLGEPLSIQRVYLYRTVNPSTGVYEFVDIKGNPTSNPSFSTDRISLVNPSKELYGGLHNSIDYKTWSLEFLFQFVKQVGNNYNLTTTGYAPGMMSNQPVIVLDRWTKDGDIRSFQKFTQRTSSPAYIAWSRSIANGSNKYSNPSYLKLSNLAISYGFSDRLNKKIGLQMFKVYVQAQNLFTVTKYQGLDPETLNNGLPPLKVIVAGIQVTL